MLHKIISIFAVFVHESQLFDVNKKEFIPNISNLGMFKPGEEYEWNISFKASAPKDLFRDAGHFSGFVNAVRPLFLLYQDHHF